MRPGTTSSQNLTVQNSDTFCAPIFGSMRIGDLSAAENVELFTYIIANGGRRFHSSHEYETFELFCQSLLAACKSTSTQPSELQHIVKIATPHFGEDQFEPESLYTQVNDYCHHLKCSQLETVQWMVRGDLKAETLRLQCLEKQRGEISASIDSLKTSGKIKRFGVFPYTETFRTAALMEPWCDVILDYYSPVENNSLDFASFRSDQKFIAIRPLHTILNSEDQSKWSFTDLLNFALKPQPAESVIVSTSTIAHAQELLSHF